MGRRHLDRGECQELLDQVVEILGKDTVIDEINSYFSTDDVEGFLRSLCSDYDIENECPLADATWDDEE